MTSNEVDNLLDICNEQFALCELVRLLEMAEVPLQLYKYNITC